MPRTCNTTDCASKSNFVPWLAILTAVGLSAAAFVVATRSRADQVVAQADDLLDICERAASQLDARLSVAS